MSRGGWRGRAEWDWLLAREEDPALVLTVTAQGWASPATRSEPGAGEVEVLSVVGPDGADWWGTGRLTPEEAAGIVREAERQCREAAACAGEP